MISVIEFNEPIVFWSSSLVAFWILRGFLLASTMQFEWKACRKGASHSRVLQSSSKYWSSCGPEGNFRMLKTWFDAGPVKTQFFLTVSPMVAFKLQLEDITPLGMVFSRASAVHSEKGCDQVWFCRPKGQAKFFTADLNFDEKPDEVKVTLMQMSGESVHDAWYLGHIFQLNEFSSEAFLVEQTLLVPLQEWPSFMGNDSTLF